VLLRCSAVMCLALLRPHDQPGGRHLKTESTGTPGIIPAQVFLFSIRSWLSAIMIRYITAHLESCTSDTASSISLLMPILGSSFVPPSGGAVSWTTRKRCVTAFRKS